MWYKDINQLKKAKKIIKINQQSEINLVQFCTLEEKAKEHSLFPTVMEWVSCSLLLTSAGCRVCSCHHEGLGSPPPGPDSGPSRQPHAAPGSAQPWSAAGSSTPDPGQTHRTGRTPHTTGEPGGVEGERGGPRGRTLKNGTTTRRLLL